MNMLDVLVDNLHYVYIKTDTSDREEIQNIVEKVPRMMSY